MKRMKNWQVCIVSCVCLATVVTRSSIQAHLYRPSRYESTNPRGMKQPSSRRVQSHGRLLQQLFHPVLRRNERSDYRRRHGSVSEVRLASRILYRSCHRAIRLLRSDSSINGDTPQRRLLINQVCCLPSWIVSFQSCTGILF
jgi:hypothetical protein